MKGDISVKNGNISIQFEEKTSEMILTKEETYAFIDKLKGFIRKLESGNINDNHN